MTRKKRNIKKLILLCAVGVLTGLLFLLTACGNAVAAPNVDKFKIDQTNKLTWEAVSGARSYVLEIKNVDLGDVEEVNAKRTSYSLADLLEGDYEIRIKAVAGNKNAKDSEWSEICYFSKEYETGCIYKLVNNVEYHISKIGSAMDNVVIEAEYRNKPVTAILETAFKGSTKITGIEIGENVQSIGRSAFYNCSNLTYVNFSKAKSLTTIGKAAFQNCRNIKEIVLPDSVTSIDEYTFAYCRGLESVDLGNGIQSIAGSAFSDCSALTSVVIPDSVTTIGEYAFSENDLLQSVSLGNGVQTINQYAFSGCKALTEVTFGEEGQLTTILDCAFKDCSALTEMKFPAGLKEIGANAFYMCTSLDTVVIPDSVDYVRKYAFHSTKLYFDAVEAGDDFIYADKWVVDCTIKERPKMEEENQSVGKVLQKITKDSFDREVVGIADRTFYGCTDLESVVLGESVKYLGERAFSHCSSLYSIDLSATSIKTIGVRAFEYCKYLSKVKLGKELPSGEVISPVERIEQYAFAYCERLINTLSGEFIPEASAQSKGITSIGQYAFYKTGLWNSPTAGVVYAGNWIVGYNGENISEVTLKEGTVGIAEYAFYNCATLTTVKSLNLAKYIGRGAFSKCSSLDRVILNKDLERIEPYTFYGCSVLFDISLPLKLQSIGKSAFSKCEKLNGLNFQTTKLKVIEDYAFNACTNIETIVFNGEIEYIGAYAFYKCAMLNSLTLPDSVKELGNRSFGNCTKLGSIAFGKGLTKIGERAFQNAQELKKIVIPSNIVEIGNYAFYKCFNVEEIVLEEGVEIIGDNAFFGLNKLQRLTLPNSIKSIGKYAFKGCEYLQSVVIGENVQSISAHAFYGCKQLTIYVLADSLPEGWHARWNSSYRPVIWGCEMEEGILTSVTIDKNTISKRDGHVIVSPKREGYTFEAWRAEMDGVEVTYMADKIDTVPVGTTLYAVWTEGDEPLIKLPSEEESNDSDSLSDSSSDSSAT